MERSIRIGKDFNVRWSIHRVMDGERQPYELAGKELVLQYRTPYGLKEATEWKVVGNTIVWTFRGKEQKALGSYELILTENGGKDGMVTVDTCRAFKLVAHSCEETEGSGSDIVIEDVVLESEVTFAALRGPQGERGPEGPQGPQGERGPQGEQGPAGPSYDDTEIKGKLAELSEEVSDISTIINGKNESEDITNKFAFVSNGGFYIAEPIGATYKGELKYTSDGDYAPGVNVSEYNSVVVSVERSGGNRNVIITDANDVVVFCEKWGDHQDNLQIHANIVDLKGVTMYVSKSAGASCSIMALVTKEGLVDKIASKVVYVSKNGSDGNKGDKENPFATIQKAIDSNATRILVGTGTYNETLDLAQYTQSRLELLNADLFGEVIIEKTPTIIATTDGNLVSGSSVVREKTITGVTSEMRCLVQLGVPYGEISLDERRPEQRGRQTRLNDTIIKRVKNVSSVTAAIAEIERAYNEDGVYMYYLSGSTMYYSRPQALSSSNPLVRPSESAKLFKNAPENLIYIISNIHTRFLAFNIDKSINSVITDCISEHSHASGGFLVNGGIGVEFVRCEALGCCYGSTGDGFNAHASGIDGYNEGNPTSKCCTIRLVNCWSHDNNDDGFSDHDRCESNVIGGLYEYNGKGGIVPSYGSHCTCYNVESRHNCNGFLSTGTPEGKEGGVGTQLTCYGCLARDNRNKYGQNYINGVDETNAGFAVMSSDCQLIAVGCVAINNKMGFFTNSGSSVANTHSELVDCKVMSNDLAYYPKDDAIVKVTNPTNL